MTQPLPLAALTPWVVIALCPDAGDPVKETQSTRQGERKPAIQFFRAGRIFAHLKYFFGLS
jgi:hypothetical protein